MNVESIIIYTSLIGILMFLSKRASIVSGNIRNIRNVYNERFLSFPLFLLIAVFTVFCAIRYNVGTDYPRYLSAFQTGRITTERFEPLFRIISSFLYDIKADVSLFFGLWAFLQIVFFLYAFKSQKELYPYLIFCLFTNNLFFSWMNTIRQDLSTCILLPCMFFILEKKPVYYFLSCVVAASIHVSALLLLLLYPLLYQRKWFEKNLLPIIIVIIAVVANFVLSDNIRGLDSIVASYSSLLGWNEVDYYSIMEGMQKREGMGIGMVARLVFFISIILSSRKIKDYFKSQFFDQIVYPLFVAGVFFKYLIPVGAIILSRPFRFFTFFTTIALAYYIYFLFHSKFLYEKVYGTLIMAIQLVFFLVPLYYANPNDSYTLYQTIFKNL